MPESVTTAQVKPAATNQIVLPRRLAIIATDERDDLASTTRDPKFSEAATKYFKLVTKPGTGRVLIIGKVGASGGSGDVYEDERGLYLAGIFRLIMEEWAKGQDTRPFRVVDIVSHGAINGLTLRIKQDETSAEAASSIAHDTIFPISGRLAPEFPYLIAGRGTGWHLLHRKAGSTTALRTMDSSTELRFWCCYLGSSPRLLREILENFFAGGRVCAPRGTLKFAWQGTTGSYFISPLLTSVYPRRAKPNAAGHAANIARQGSSESIAGLIELFDDISKVEAQVNVSWKHPELRAAIVGAVNETKAKGLDFTGSDDGDEQTTRYALRDQNVMLAVWKRLWASRSFLKQSALWEGIKAHSGSGRLVPIRDIDAFFRDQSWVFMSTTNVNFGDDGDASDPDIILFATPDESTYDLQRSARRGPPEEDPSYQARKEITKGRPNASAELDQLAGRLKAGEVYANWVQVTLRLAFKYTVFEADSKKVASPEYQNAPTTSERFWGAWQLPGFVADR